MIPWLAKECEQHLLNEKWLLAEDLRIAQQWKDRLNLAGYSSINLHAKTIRSLTAFLSGSLLAESQLTFIGEAATRMMIHALLRRDGLTKAATLPISAGIVSQKHRYIEALTEYRMGDFVPIVELGADATFAALRNATHLFDDVVQMQRQWRERTSSLRSDALAHQIIEQLLSHPVVDTEILEPILEASPAAIRRALNDLVDRRIVEPVPRADPGVQRFVAQDIVRALNSFTERSINPFRRH